MKPEEWLPVIGAEAKSIIRGAPAPRRQVDKVFYGLSHLRIGLDECCGGVIVVDILDTWPTNPASWPNELPLASPRNSGCDIPDATRYKLRYHDCFDQVQSNGKTLRPDDYNKLVVEFVQLSNKLANEMDCAISRWAKTNGYGRGKRGRTTRMAPDGQCVAFEMELTMPTTPCWDCAELTP